MNKELKSQHPSNPFTKYSISLRIGESTINSNEVTKELFLEQIKIHNDKKHLNFLPNFLNIELIEAEKALLFYEILTDLEDRLYEKLADKVLYVNNPEFYLYPGAPSNLETYEGNSIEFDIASDANDLIFLSAKFEKLNPLSNELLIEVEQFIINKNLEIQNIEEGVIEAENKKNYEKLSNLYTQLRELKYARFSAFKILKINVELIQDSKSKEDLKLNNLDLLFEEYLVPPIH